MNKRCFLIWFCLLVVCNTINHVNCQRNNRNQKQKQTPTKKPVGGRWVPLRERLAAEKRKQNAANKKNNNQKNQNSNFVGGSNSVNFDDLIQPPLLRLPNEVELQDPSWTHCLHNVPVTENWAVIASPNFPQPIQGQMQCTWIFEGVRGMRLQISFNVLDLQGGKGGRCGNQFIDLIDLELKKSQGRFCGDRVPGDYVSVGRLLRLDIQGDTAPTPHTGFQAAVRTVSLGTRAGLRQRSTMFHGSSTSRIAITLPPIKRRPESLSTRRRLGSPIFTTSTTTTTEEEEILWGQILYGPNRQPRPRAEINKYEPVKINTTLILYIFIGFFCFLVVLSGILFIFRKQIYAKYKQSKRRKKNKKEQNESETIDEEEESVEDTEDEKESRDGGNDNLAFSNRLSLPESRPTTPGLDGRRRKSVVFEDEVIAGIVREPPRRNSNEAKTDDVTNSDPFQSEQSLTNMPEDGRAQQQFQEWNYPNGEPIYEDDTMSVASYASRISNRHPDHSTLRKQKIIERNSSLQQEDVYAPISEPTYHVGPPVPHPGQQNMPPPFYPGFSPFHPDPRDPYAYHAQMMTNPEAFSRGGHMLPPNYNESLQDTRIEVPPPIYNDYHQGRLSQAPLQNQRSQDDIDVHKQLIAQSSDAVSLRSSASMGNLSVIGDETANNSNFPLTQSMAALPLSTQNLPTTSGLRQRSQSFTM